MRYYPFGMPMLNRGYGASYRFGFNGKEQDNEVEGKGNIYDYGFRIYNPRLGKFLSVDPLTKKYPWFTPYQFAGNNPILNLDMDGRENFDYKKFQAAMIAGAAQLSKIPFPSTRSPNEPLRDVSSKNPSWTNGGSKEIHMAQGMPAEAVKQFADHPKDFQMDCGSFCQAVLLTGMLEGMGIDKFNKHFDGDFTLQNQASPGLQVKDVWEKKGDKLFNNEKKVRDVNSVLDKADYGTVVNLNSSFMQGTPFYNENIIKVGGDLYLAQGITKDGKPISLDAVKTGLLKLGGLDATKSNMKKVSVQQVTEYKLPN